VALDLCKFSLEVMNETVVTVNINRLYHTAVVLDCSVLIAVLCYTWFLLLCEPLCFEVRKFQDFPSL
jgi:hypothetical protein